MFLSALKWMHNVQGDVLGEEISYTSIGGSPRKIKAVPGRFVFRVSDGYGASIRIEAQDFIVSIDELPDPPQKGDRVQWRGRNFEVLAPEGEQVWRWMDMSHSARRIHTKEV